ncbi:MAG: hypothetical protein Q9N02_06665 [Ghiorsea sp.]|nr:hypothetical protein [Ghiorsea sp.]
MISIKKMTLAATCTSILLAAPAWANETYVCTHGHKERQISVVYANDTQAVPCEVTYTKLSDTESLWQAQNLAGYCEEKAAAFVEKQRAWGWDCAKQK